MKTPASIKSVTRNSGGARGAASDGGEQCFGAVIGDASSQIVSTTEAASSSTLRSCKGRRKQQPVGCWTSDEIKRRIEELEAELKISKRHAEDNHASSHSNSANVVSLSASRIKRVKERLRVLQKGLAGKKTIGGQLAKKVHMKRNLQREDWPSLRNSQECNAKHHRGGVVKKIHKSIKCLQCRKGGHLLRDCPLNVRLVVHKDEEKNALTAAGRKTCGFCFNCGEKDHILKQCKKSKSEDGYLPFAICFICNVEGHLAVNCPQNNHGIFPKGGGCRVCGSVFHKQAFCPEKQKELRCSGGKKSALKLNGVMPNDSDEYWMQKVGSMFVEPKSKLKFKT